MSLSLRDWLQATRPHFFSFSASAFLVGAADAQQPYWKAAIYSCFCGVAWGVGQLLNDYRDRFLDADIAPERPFVKSRPSSRALYSVVSVLGLTLSVVMATWDPLVLLFAAVGAGLMLVYNSFKRLVLLGSLSHSALMVLAYACGRAPEISMTGFHALCRAEMVVPFLFIGLVNFNYVEANYEKDMSADKAHGYVTFAARFGIRSSVVLRIVSLSLLWLLLFGQVELSIWAVSSLAVLSLLALRSLKQPSESAALVQYPSLCVATLVAYFSLGGGLSTLERALSCTFVVLFFLFFSRKNVNP